MARKNDLAHPVYDHIRLDGRVTHAPDSIDFRDGMADSSMRTMAVDGERKFMVPGTIFGAIVRYQWTSFRVKSLSGVEVIEKSSRRIHLLGSYTGQEVDTPVTARGFTSKEPINLPLMDVKLWADPYTKIEIGQLAMCYLEGRRRIVAEEINLDHQTIMDSLEIEPEAAEPRSRLGAVQFGGLYYVLPLEC
jgi:hypothetical protein